MLPASTQGLYRGCAFNDAAAMSATVSRLEGDLARAKLALNERLALEEGHLRQRRELEAEVARLRSEVSVRGPSGGTCHFVLLASRLFSLELHEFEGYNQGVLHTGQGGSTWHTAFAWGRYNHSVVYLTLQLHTAHFTLCAHVALMVGLCGLQALCP